MLVFSSPRFHLLYNFTFFLLPLFDSRFKHTLKVKRSGVLYPYSRRPRLATNSYRLSIQYNICECHFHHIDLICIALIHRTKTREGKKKNPCSGQQPQCRRVAIDQTSYFVISLSSIGHPSSLARDSYHGSYLHIHRTILHSWRGKPSAASSPKGMETKSIFFLSLLPCVEIIVM